MTPAELSEILELAGLRLSLRWHRFAATWPAVTHKGRARRQRHRRAARQAARHLEHLEHVQTDRSAFSAPVGVYGPRTAVGYHHPRDPENARDSAPRAEFDGGCSLVAADRASMADYTDVTSTEAATAEGDTDTTND